MANWNKLTENQFNAIKILLKGGATQQEAAEYMQIHVNTVNFINKAETFEEYQHIQAERQLSRNRQVAAMKARDAAQAAANVGAVPASTLAQPAEVVKEVRQTVTVQSTHYMMQEMQKTNELLKQISAKLAFIVEDLYGTGKKDG